MKLLTLLAVLVVASAALAGCTGNNNATTTTPTTTTTSSTPVSTTPSTSTPPVTTPNVTTPTLTTPTLTTPTTPTVPTNPVVASGTITSVYVLSAPVNVAALNDTANVCFRVGGNGTVAHVAVHYDTVSHPNSTAFTDYKGGAAYADEASKTLTAMLPIPGAWCVTLPVSASTIYYRAHAFVGAQSVLSVEKTVTAGAQPVDVSGYFPQVASPNSTVTLCWNATGPGTSRHTAIHYDFASHPNSTAFSDYAGGAIYNETGSQTLSANLTLPGSWCAKLNVTQPVGAVYYLRAHALVNNSGTETSLLGPERSIVVAPALGVTNGLPAKAAANSNVLVCWRAEGNESVPHTALHWDTESHAGETNVTFGTYNGGAPVYPNNQTTPAGNYQLPGPFCSNLKMPASGTLYFVAHVLNPATGRDELSREYSIVVG